MSVLIAVVALFCVLGVVNLLLCVGIIRRLREHTELLGKQSGGVAAGPPMRAVGEIVGPFEADTVDGIAVGSALLAGTTMVGVFTPGCGPCKERLPQFVEHAATRERDRVLAVVAGTEEESAAYVAQLTSVALVVREDDGGPVTTALDVRGFPSFALLDADGRVLASGITLDALTVPA